MNDRQTFRRFVAAWMILPALVMSGVFLAGSPVSADPARSSVKCKDGKSVEVRPDMKPDKSILNDKDYEYGCRNNGGYRSIDETILCNDDSMQSVYKDAADPKDKLNDKDRKKACASHGGIKKEVTDVKEEEKEKEKLAALESNVAGDGCGGVETAIVKCSESNSGAVDDNGIWGLLLLALNILTAGVGIVAVGGIVYGAVLYTTAGDKADQVKKATGIITNVVIGMVAFAIMWAGLNFIVPGGVFDNGVNNNPSPTKDSPGDDGDGNDDGDGGNGGNGGNGGDGDSNKVPTIEDINVRNMRDAAASNNVLKKGTLFRSMMLGNIGPKDTQELAEVLGSNGLIIDLRTTAQSAEAPDKNIPGVRNINIPIDGVLDTAPMVTDATRRAQLAKALKAAANAKGPVLIHCAAGKDRTGWMVAMIMYASGASDAQVKKEYLKSNDEMIDGGVKAEWLASGLQAMRSQYGSFKGYMKAIGLSDADVQNVKKKFGA